MELAELWPAWTQSKETIPHNKVVGAYDVALYGANGVRLHAHSDCPKGSVDDSDSPIVYINPSDWRKLREDAPLIDPPRPNRPPSGLKD